MTTETRSRREWRLTKTRLSLRDAAWRWDSRSGIYRPRVRFSSPNSCRFRSISGNMKSIIVIYCHKGYFHGVKFIQSTGLCSRSPVSSSPRRPALNRLRESSPDASSTPPAFHCLGRRSRSRAPTAGGRSSLTSTVASDSSISRRVRTGVTCELEGFATAVREHVILVVGQTVELPVTMELTGLTETVTVVAPSPIVDAKQTGTATNVTRDELANDPDLARPVLADALGPRRARRPRQRRRQRDGPAVELRLEGHPAAGRGVDARRRRDHRHDADGIVADLFQLRQLRRDPRLDRRPGDHAADRRRRPRLHRQARHQPVPRRRALVLRRTTRWRRRTCPPSSRPGASRRRRRTTTSRSPTTASRSADRSCATTRGSTAPTRAQDIQLARRAGSVVDRTQLEESEREGELAGDREGHGQLPVFRRVQDQGQPQPRHVRHHLRRADRDVPPGQRLHGQPAARAVQARG